MKILVDADSCPREARELILRCAARLGIQAVFAANRRIPGIAGKWAIMEICPASINAADDRLAELASPGDLVISRDIPLAQRMVEAGIATINDRGREYNRENIREMLSLRNFALGLAENGLDVERIPAYGRKELKTFADALDRILTRLRALSLNKTSK
jgi:uncharacterized protein YaiI (UPF0178 family)